MMRREGEEVVKVGNGFFFGVEMRGEERPLIGLTAKSALLRGCA